MGFGLLAALVVGPDPARASEWWYVNSGPGRVLFVDAASIERDRDTVTYWTMHVIHPGEPEVMTKSHMRADCGKRRLRRLEMLRFDAAGRALDDDALSPRQSVFSVAPDTLGDAEFRFACGDEGHRVTNDLFPLAIDAVTFADALIAQGNIPATAHDLHEAMVRRDTGAVASRTAKIPNDRSPPVVQSTLPNIPEPDPDADTPISGEEIERLESACGGGTVGACTELGNLFADGQRVRQDLARAATYFDRSCTGGDADGCTMLGIAYYEGKGVATNRERSAAAFAQACELGGATACGNFGLALVKGEGIAKDVGRATIYFAKACDAGNAASCSSLGASYSLGAGVTADAARARRLFKRSCDGGAAGGCYNLGVVYDQGLGVRKDPAQAASLYATACDQDSAEACANLGSLAQNGRGIAKDAGRAADLFRKACDLGDADGCLHLGRVYQAGSGVTRDLNQAEQYFRKALAIEPDKSDARRALSDLLRPNRATVD